jgi:hypothetical protein
MKKSNKLALVKPSAISLPAMTPPPRKEDIINAMLERARVKHEEESQRLKDEERAAKQKFDAALMAELKAHPEKFTIESKCWGGSAEVHYVLHTLSPNLEKLRIAYRTAPTLRSFDAVAVKRHIRESMSTAGDRVKALLDNPEAVKKLDATLARIN